MGGEDGGVLESLSSASETKVVVSDTQLVRAASRGRVGHAAGVHEET